MVVMTGMTRVHVVLNVGPDVSEGRFRFWLAVLGGLMLPLPLIWLSLSLFGGSATRASRSLALVPMLSPSEREGTLTYGRECRTHGDCDPRLRCFSTPTLDSNHCVDSRCVTDENCPEGFSCHTYPVKSRQEGIRVCSVVGLRREGEVCSSWTRDPEYGCARGLLCHTRCGRPCEPDNPSTCPEGFFCEGAREGAACQPTCEGLTCPEGQQCIGVGGRRSICAKVHGRNCQSEPCGPSQYCSVSVYPQPVHEVWMRCTQACGLEGKPPCPEGHVCERHQCLSRCSPNGGTSCDEGFRCAGSPAAPWVCTPDVPSSL